MPNLDLSSNLLHLKDKLASIPRPADSDHVEAVVAILLWDEPGRSLTTLLVQRAEREGDPWSGQIGLPGGRVKQAVESPRAALHREVEEEVGIRLEEFGVELGSLAVGHPMRRIEMRVQPMSDITIRNQPWSVESYFVEGRVVWGFTYRVLTELLPILDASR